MAGFDFAWNWLYPTFGAASPQQGESTSVDAFGTPLDAILPSDGAPASTGASSSGSRSIQNQAIEAYPGANIDPWEALQPAWWQLIDLPDDLDPILASLIESYEQYNQTIAEYLSENDVKRAQSEAYLRDEDVGRLIAAEFRRLMAREPVQYDFDFEYAIPGDLIEKLNNVDSLLAWQEEFSPANSQELDRNRRVRDKIIRDIEYFGQNGRYMPNMFEELGHNAVGMGRAALDSALFGFWDELVGLGGGLFNVMSPGGFGEGYDRARAAELAALDAYAAENPILAGIGSITGAVAPFAFGPLTSLARWAGNGPTIGNRLARGGTLGGLFGTAEGVGRGEGDILSRLSTAASYGGAGVFGGVLPSVFFEVAPGYWRRLWGGDFEPPNGRSGPRMPGSEVQMNKVQELQDAIDAAAIGQPRVPTPALEVSDFRTGVSNFLVDTKQPLSPAEEILLQRLSTPGASERVADWFSGIGLDPVASLIGSPSPMSVRRWIAGLEGGQTWQDRMQTAFDLIKQDAVSTAPWTSLPGQSSVPFMQRALVPMTRSYDLWYPLLTSAPQ